jgi:hypothetical protein
MVMPSTRAQSSDELVANATNGKRPQDISRFDRLVMVALRLPRIREKVCNP